VREGDRTLNEILDAVAARYEIARGQLVSGRSCTRARLVAKYLASRVTRYSLRQIGGRFRGVSGTNVLHAVRTVERYMAEDADFAAEVEAIKASLLTK